MAAQALYRRWRPQTFDDVFGQAPIVRTLRNAVASDRLAHAYLFTGVRGTGKTSVARILAKAANCTGGGDKPCNACDACVSITEGRALDLIEIDAASNTGVDDVRDLRDKINFAPNALRYKVYIIDEVHMLSTAAFNALLKTLEEPPAHALFILATTEPHKVPDTIVSRCQRHDFRRVPREVLVGKLERIAAAEGVRVEPAALELLAKTATGSFRDAESLLDQVLATGEDVTLELVRETLGTPTGEIVGELVAALVAGDAAAGLGRIDAALDQGVDPRQLQGQLLDALRQLMLVQMGVDPAVLDLPAEAVAQLQEQASRIAPAALTAAIRRFNEARPSPDRSQPGLALELALVETVLATTAPEPAPDRANAQQPNARQPDARQPGAHEPNAQQPGTRPPSPPPVGEPPAGAGAAAPAERPARPAPRPTAGGEAAPAPTQPSPSAPSRSPGRVGLRSGGSGPELGQVSARWGEVLAAVAAHDKSTAALLKDCRPVAADAETVTLGFYYQFHCDRVSEPARSRLVAGALADVFGSPRKLLCTVVPATASEDADRPRSKTDQARTDPVVRHAVENLGAQISGVDRPPET
jgi:DNA polymerase-3 subunit gamma/tau